jgi:hypothetical protein
MCRRRKTNKDEEPDPWRPLEKPVSTRRAPAGEGDPGVRLRAEMLPASQASRRFKAYRPRIKAGQVWTFIVVLALAGLGWFFGLGPGRSLLEQGLANLANLYREVTAPTATLLPTDTSLPPTATQTRQPTATWKPSWTPTSSFVIETMVDAPTVSPTDTPVSFCRDFSTITLADLGQVLCVQGTVIRVIENVGNTLVVFSDEPGMLYLVTYDVDWPDGTIGACYQATGEIQRLLNSPVIVFSYNNLPQECP